MCVFTACSDDAFFRRVQSVSGDCWSMGDDISFSVDISDTSAMYDVFVELRSSDAYPSRKFFRPSTRFIFGGISDSVAVLDVDTLKCILSDKFGKPTGKGLSNVKENTIAWKRGYKFPHEGVFSLSLSHGMRNVELPGVSSVGVVIRPAEGEK